MEIKEMSTLLANSSDVQGAKVLAHTQFVTWLGAGVKLVAQYGAGASARPNVTKIMCSRIEVWFSQQAMTTLETRVFIARIECLVAEMFKKHKSYVCQTIANAILIGIGSALLVRL